jgi:lipoprotein-releasing system permease protein
MRAAAPLHIAWRLVFRRERRISSHLKGTVLGISLSLIPLVLVMVVSSGLIEGITARFLELGSFHLQARSYDEQISWEESAARLEEEPGVLGAFPVIEGLGMLYSPQGRAGVGMKGLYPGRWERDSGFREYMIIEEGSFDLDSAESAVITRGVADKLMVGLGDKVKLLTSRTSSSGALFLRPSFFTVTGICSTGYYELDALTLYVPYSRADSILKDQGTRYIGLKVRDPYGDLGSLRRRIGRELGNAWYLMSWQELQRPMYASFNTSRNLILLIMGLIVLVATLNISATLSMLVLENQEQIAILKATGSSPSQIRMIFVAAGLMTGLAGLVPGLALGLFLAVNVNRLIALMENGINLAVALLDRISPFLSVPSGVELFDSSFYLDTIPVDLDPLTLWATALFTLLTAVLAALVPASRAAVLRPLEILQKR